MHITFQCNIYCKIPALTQHILINGNSINTRISVAHCIAALRKKNADSKFIYIILDVSKHIPGIS